jgi:hypothetical protein
MRKKPTTDGSNRLEEAIALLIQNQAVLMQTQTMFVQNQTAFVARMSEMDQRLVRIEATLETILRVLAEHQRILEGLPDAIQKKIGFQPSE